MIRFVRRRLALSLVAVWGAFTAVFLSTYLSGDPAVLFAPEGAPAEVIDQFRRELGYDRPLAVQYLDFLGNALTGQFPDSLVYSQPALDVVLSRVGATLQLAGTAIVVAAVLGLGLGYASARSRGRWGRLLPMWFVSLVQATPSFYLALLAVLLLGVQLRVLPTGGSGSPAHLVMPALVLGIFTTPGLARVFRSSLRSVEDDDFIRTARAKGVGRGRIARGHLVPNALLPVVTVLGMELGALMGGAVIVEMVFSWPGVGRLAVQAISQRDYPVVLAVVTVLAAGFVLVNVVVDLLYGVLDPRIRVSGARSAT